MGNTTINALNCVIQRSKRNLIPLRKNIVLSKSKLKLTVVSIPSLHEASELPCSTNNPYIVELTVYFLHRHKRKLILSLLFLAYVHYAQCAKQCNWNTQ